jgi:hypothetical protein
VLVREEDGETWTGGGAGHFLADAEVNAAAVYPAILDTHDNNS